MATKLFIDFLPEVTPHVQGCSDITAVNAVRNATIELCDTAFVWHEIQDAATYNPTDFPTDVDAPAGAHTALILGIKCNGRDLEATTADWLDANEYDWENRTGTPRHYFQTSPDMLYLFPTPDSQVTLRCRVAYAPLRDSSGVEEYIYQNYLEDIAAGALARLLVMPGVPWTNPRLAEFYAAKFKAGIGDAIIETRKSFTRAKAQVRLPRF